MDKSDAKSYRERWREVERIEQEASRNTSFQDRWRQLNAINRRARRLGISRQGDEGEMEVFLRWARLKDIYDSSKRKR